MPLSNVANMGSLTSLLGKAPRVAVLEVFAENSDLPFSVPEIVKETGVSKRGAYIHVRKLVEEGVLRKSHKQGKCLYYRLNPNDRRAELLPLLESVLTLGRLEREIKRDREILPEEPLVPVPILAERTVAQHGPGFAFEQDIALEPHVWNIMGAKGFRNLVSEAFRETITAGTAVAPMPESEAKSALSSGVVVVEPVKPSPYRLRTADSIAAT